MPICRRRQLSWTRYPAHVHHITFVQNSSISFVFGDWADNKFPIFFFLSGEQLKIIRVFPLAVVCIKAEQQQYANTECVIIWGRINIHDEKRTGNEEQFNSANTDKIVRVFQFDQDKAYLRIVDKYKLSNESWIGRCWEDDIENYTKSVICL